MFSEFQWDSRKRETNLSKHGIDFDDAARIFERPVITKPGHPGRDGERRNVVVGLLNGIEVTVVYTVRDKACRLISARQASEDERKAYRTAYPSNPSQG